MLGDLDAGKFEERGWTNWGYGLSKMFLIRYVLWQGQQKFYQDNNIQVIYLFFKGKRFIQCAQVGAGPTWLAKRRRKARKKAQILPCF
jgi:hypothetical protein